MAKNKNKHKGRGSGKPKGATYADVLARRMAIQRGLEKYGADQAMQIEADIHTQRAMWLMVCSIADAFKAGPERMKRDFFPALQENTDELNEMREKHGDDYAYEKLKQRAQQVTGIEIQYMYEHEMREAGLKLAEDGGYEPLTRLDRIKERIRTANAKQMAEIIREYTGDDDGGIAYCQNLPECDMILTEGLIPEEKCLECLVKWLEEPEEEEHDSE